MKIKGWKKVNEEKYLIVYESIKENRIGIMQRTFQNYWSIFYNGNERYPINKPNKQQALNYIVDYMRSHPNG